MKTYPKFLIGLWVVWLAACAPSIAATRGPTPTAGRETPPAPAETASPTPIAEPPSQSMKSSTNMPDSTSMRPLVTLSASIAMSGWSPDGIWIAYRDGDNVLVLNVDTGAKCPIGSMPREDPYSETLWSWLPDSRVLIVEPEQGEARALAPCSDQPGDLIMGPLQGTIRRIASISPDRHLFVIDTNRGYWLYDAAAARQWPVEPDLPDAWGFAWSPGMTRLAVSGSLPTNDPDTRTWAIDVATGTLLADMQWSRWIADPPRGPDWLDESRFIIAITRAKRGPLLVTPGEDTTGIPTALFGLDCAATACQQTFVWSAAIQPGGSYHLLLTDQRQQPDTRVMLYHSETGAVESFEGAAELSSDGGLLLLNGDPRQGAQGRAIRPVDPPGAASQSITIPGGRWRPGSNVIIAVEGPDVALYSVPSGTLLGHWKAESYTLSVPDDDSWSPDGRRLIITGQNGAGQNTVFVIDLP